MRKVILLISMLIWGLHDQGPAKSAESTDKPTYNHTYDGSAYPNGKDPVVRI
jgi:hypothetical protein